MWKDAMKLKNKKLLLIAIEIVVVIVLLIITVSHNKNLTNIETDLSKFSSEYPELKYLDGVWKQNNTNIKLDKPVSLINSNDISLGAGSYTLVIEYESDKQLNGLLSSATGRAFLHSGTFLMSRNKKSVECDFYVTREIPDLRLNIGGYVDGDFVLRKVSILENNNNYRNLCFIWIVLSILTNIVCLSPWYKDNKRIINILLLIALLASVPEFMAGIGIGHDTGFHLVRMEGIAEGLKRGEFPVGMNSVFDDGYGYPVDVFYPNLLLYIPAVLRVIGFSIVTALKVYIFIINYMTVVFFYIFGREFFTDKRIAILSAAAYALSSYRLVNLWVRQSLGEYTAMAFFPLIALAMWRTYTNDVNDKKYKSNSVLLGLGMLGLLYSHVLSTEMAACVLIVFAIAFAKKTFQLRRLLELVKAVIIFVFGGAAFIYPFLDYFINSNNCIKASGEDMHFIQERGAYISDYFAFFRNVFGFDSVVSAERMQLTPGFVLVSALLIGIVMMILDKASSRIRFMIISATILLFVSTSIFPWNYFAAYTKLGNTLAAQEFPWRYIGFATIFLSILLGLIVEYAVENGFEPKLLLSMVSVCIMLVLGNFVSIYAQGTIQKNYIDTAEIPTYTGGKVSPVNGVEYLLRGTDIDILDYAIIAENGSAKIIEESGVNMTLAVQMPDRGTITVPRFAYPHYVAIDDQGRYLNIENGDNNKIKVIVPWEYNGNIRVEFDVPRRWRWSELCSLLCVLGIVAWSVWKRKENGNSVSKLY